MKKPKLMSGFSKRQAFRNPEALAEKRNAGAIGKWKNMLHDQNIRVSESKANFGWKFFRGDFHSHTVHSDGVGTVAETAEMAAAAGFDFQYVTDHWGITQAPECRKHGLWIGQEPGTKDHHMGIIGLDHAFTPQQDFLADIAAAKKLGATVFVPHPTGWWPRTVYKQISHDLLEQLPDPYLMEIANGAGNMYSVFDYTDESAIKLWDHLLNLGKTVHAMGNTDAHSPDGIGMVWNCVFAPRCEEKSILNAVSKGRSFVSDGPLVHIKLGKAQMGQKVSADELKNGLEVTAVDSRGLAWVQVIADGKRVHRLDAKGESSVSKKFKIPAKVKRFVRVEVRSEDGRRAYSNPIYLKG